MEMFRVEERNINWEVLLVCDGWFFFREDKIGILFWWNFKYFYFLCGEFIRKLIYFVS